MLVVRKELHLHADSTMAQLVMSDEVGTMITPTPQFGSSAACPNLGEGNAYKEDVRIIYACDGKAVFAKKWGHYGELKSIKTPTGKLSNATVKVGRKIPLDTRTMCSAMDSWNEEIGLGCEVTSYIHDCGGDKGSTAQYALVKKAGVTWDDVKDEEIYKACVWEQW